MSAAVHSMALDQHLREADTTSSLVVSVRSAILGEFVRGGAKTAGGDSEMKWRTKTSASRDQKGQQQQPTETRLGASPSCPPLFEDVTVTAASSPRDAANLGSLSPGGREQEQRQEEAVLSMTRSVSFNEVVKVSEPPLPHLLIARSALARCSILKYSLQLSGGRYLAMHHRAV